ncbi:anaphase-promoting complex subunit 15 isoform X1 [Ctenocephalides felis]|uniref:anaphase-promoting complex subunit 15 isoform X1 n=1 Tax=Ctenocephalides felis TaxID=7515 RepID=UPI000E6E2401|nr:anaphase-promoting complex subunit 15 isoform X1 [Ctenocephalides felis]
MSLPSMLPSLRGIVINPVWFNVDSPCDDEADVAGLEQEHQSWLNSIAQFNIDTVPIGKLTIEHLSEEPDTDDEDGNDDTDDTDSHDEEDDEDMILDVTGRGYIPPEELRGQPQNIAAQHAVSR